MKKKIWISSLVLLLILILYTIYDNHRFIVVEEEINVEALASEFVGLKILQITDLHEKEFGRNQKRLIERINKISYDVIVFTGDMLDGKDSTNYSSFYDLIEGITNKEHALFVPGNADPTSYSRLTNGEMIKTPFIEGVEARGVTYLEALYSLEIDGVTIDFVDFELSTKNNQSESKLDSNSYSTSQNNPVEKLAGSDNYEEERLLIALNHYPVVDPYIDFLQKEEERELRNYDVIIAGHYHGGQIRLPFIGALFVPEPWYNNNGLFPPKDRVKGLWEYEGIQQYVSAGLGSSRYIPLLNFRFLNPPEINLITVK